MISLGDRPEDSTIRFIWPVSSLGGAGSLRSTDGSVVVYKDGGTTEITAGITDTDNFDGTAGLNLCVIDLSADAAYAAGAHDYDVVLKGATIDGVANVIGVIAHFTIDMWLANLISRLAAIEADTQDIQTRLPAALHGSGNMKSQVLGIVAETLQGDGTLGNEFRPV